MTSSNVDSCIMNCLHNALLTESPSAVLLSNEATIIAFLRASTLKVILKMIGNLSSASI